MFSTLDGPSEDKVKFNSAVRWNVWRALKYSNCLMMLIACRMVDAELELLFECWVSRSKSNVLRLSEERYSMLKIRDSLVAFQLRRPNEGSSTKDLMWKLAPFKKFPPRFANRRTLAMTLFAFSWYSHSSNPRYAFPSCSHSWKASIENREGVDKIACLHSRLVAASSSFSFESENWNRWLKSSFGKKVNGSTELEGVEGLIVGGLMLKKKGEESKKNQKGDAEDRDLVVKFECLLYYQGLFDLDFERVWMEQEEVEWKEKEFESCFASFALKSEPPRVKDRANRPHAHRK